MKQFIKKLIRYFWNEQGIWFCIKVKYMPLNLICALFPMRDEIIFESHPNFTDNAFELYRYMVDKKVYEKYKMSWLVHEPNKYKDRSDLHGDLIEIEPKTFKEWWRKYFRCNRAKIVLSCNRHVNPLNAGNKQLSVDLSHGMPMKYVSTFCGKYYCVTSAFFANLISEKFDEDYRKFKVLGLARNDQLFRKDRDLNKLIKGFLSFKNVVVWLPTFRKHKDKNRIDCDFEFPLGIPILYCQDDVCSLNDFLKKENVLVIVKPHPAQDLSEIKDLDVSNIMFLYDKDLRECEIQLYELLAQTDAMITDYSSVYFDYLLTDKPIGITMDDSAAYGDQFGYVLNPTTELCGQYMYSLEDMKKFISDVTLGKDSLLKQRTLVKNKVHDFTDNCSTQRIYEFVCEEVRKNGWEM